MPSIEIRRPARRYASRRGSFLVLVVGVLVLLAVITLVYVSIGRSDRQTSAAVSNSSASRRVPEEMRDYLAGIVGADVFDRFHAEGVGPVGGSRAPLGNAREAWDYPSTAFYEQAWPSFDSPLRRPVLVRPGPAAVRFNPTGDGTGTDPWLAESTPRFIGATAFNDDPTRDFRFNFDPRFERQTDWGNVSNVSPDGSAVNLWALRSPRAGGPTGGGFDADSELLRDNLSVFDPGRRPVPLGTGGGRPHESRDWPAALSSNQLHAFLRLSSEPGPGVAPYAGSNARFWPGYQWADTDGDGFTDARIFEMVDASRGAVPRDWERLLPNDPDVRWFFAARIEDLSAALNVNTAGDFRGEPRTASLPGGTPADADLLRLLTQTDTAVDYGTELYSALFQPAVVGPARVAEPQRAQDYQEYDYANALTWDLGVNAFREIGRTFDRGRVSGRDDALVGTYSAEPAGRSFRFLSRAGLTDALTYDQTADEFRFGSIAGIEDLAELRTYETVNDGRTTSRLESAVSIRTDLTFSGATPNTRRRFDPLRSNRSLDVERDNPAITDTQARARAAFDVRQHLTPASGARPLRSALLNEARDPEQRSRFADALGRFELKADALGMLEAGDVRGLFHAYADVLLPFADRPDAWPAGATGQATAASRTLFYGHQGPEFALYCAGALTVNLMDSYDTDNTPTAATLLVSEDPSSSPPLYQQFVADAQNPDVASRRWPHSPVAVDSSVVPVRRNGSNWSRDGARVPLVGLMDLNRWYEPAPEARGSAGIPANATPVRMIGPNPNDGGVNRLARATGVTRSRAVTMYGIEAQPFITEVGTLFFYVDKPDGVTGSTPNGGDTEPVKVRDGLLGANGVLRSGTPSGNNDEDFKDLIFQVFAVQLTNPFSFRVSLTEGDSQYYVEFGGRHFLLQSRDINPTTGQLGPAAPIVLEPHETAVFIVLNDTPERIVSMLERIRTGGVRQGRLTNPIRAQELIEWINAQFRVNGQFQRRVESGALTEADLGSGPLPRLIPFYNPQTGEVRESGRSDLTPRTISVISHIDTENREVRLWRRVIAGGTTESINANALQNDQLMDRMFDPATFAELRGTTFVSTLDRSINLVGNAVGDSNDLEHGGLAFTTWASIRRPNAPSSGAGTSRFQTPVGAVPAYAIELKPTDVVAQPLNAVLRWPTGASGQIRQLDINRDFDRTEARIEFGELWLGQLSSAMVGQITERAEAKTANDIPANLSGRSFLSLNAQIWLDNQRFERDVPNQANFKRSIARVGDLLLPLAVAPMFDPDNPEPQGGWTTLSESLSRVLDYDGTWAGSSTTNGFRRMGFDDPSGADVNEGTLFRGRLWLDRYAPFYDANENGVFDPDASDPEERPMGSSGPIAWRIFDVFAPMHRLRNGSRVVSDAAAYGSLVTATPGVVNISTAPLNVLRTLPMLSPDATPTAWWWNDGVFTPSTDIAATLKAFRDKQPEDPRGTGPSTQLWFRDSTGTGAIPDGRRLLATSPPVGQGADLLRLQPFNEFPGFRSLSEAFGARFPASVSGAPADQHSIDRLARDNRATGRPAGQDSAVDMPFVLPGGDWYWGYTDGTGTRPDNYAEQLTVMNALSGTASVRSDYFVAWFVAMGFRRADVESLSGPNDPLVPSIRRRFMMVIDRSNVTTRTDRPRILLFREVPF